jgi:hypothetical protein
MGYEIVSGDVKFNDKVVGQYQRLTVGKWEGTGDDAEFVFHGGSAPTLQEILSVAQKEYGLAMDYTGIRRGRQDEDAGEKGILNLLVEAINLHASRKALAENKPGVAPEEKMARNAVKLLTHDLAINTIKMLLPDVDAEEFYAKAKAKKD